jgi:molybdopterin converting factor subunit 1
MKILFFAQSRQASGCADYLLKTGGPISQDELWTLLLAAFPSLASQRKTARLARNETYLQGDELLHPDDEVAVIPPVSGG